MSLNNNTKRELMEQKLKTQNVKEAESKKDETKQKKKKEANDDEDDKDSNSEEDIQNAKLKRWKSDTAIYDNAHNATMYEKKTIEIQISDFDLICPINKGAYGRVYLVQRRSTRDYFAMKVVRFPKNIDQRMFENIRNERNILNKLTGDHVVKAYFVLKVRNFIIFIMEYMPSGDFNKVLKEEQYLDQNEEAKFYMAELVLAIEYLHSNGIVHHDLKPDNILLDKELHLKLADFGLSNFRSMAETTEEDAGELFHDLVAGQEYPNQIKKEKQKKPAFNLASDKKNQDGPEEAGGKTEPNDNKPNNIKKNEDIPKVQIPNRVVGTPDYMPPEVVKGLDCKNERAGDWWALGVIFYEFLVGTPPFNDLTVEQVFDNIRNYPNKFQIKFPVVGDDPSMLSRAAKDLLDRLLDPNPDTRLGSGPTGAEEIKSHPYFKGTVWEKVKSTPPPLDIIPRDPSKEKKTEMNIEDIFKEKDEIMNETQKKSKKAEDIEEMYRVDLLHKDNEKEYQEYIQTLDNIKNNKKRIFEKLYDIEKQDSEEATTS